MGFRETVGIRIVGRKFVLLAAEIVFSAAVIRPKLNILHEEIEIPSKSKELYLKARRKSSTKL